MTVRQYHYVGPADIREAACAASSGGALIRSVADLTFWIDQHASEREADGSFIATFTINTEGMLLLAPRRSEHVACAGGGPVLSAGEITFSPDAKVWEVTNQSTGFCPEPESWPVVAAALDSIAVERPDDFTTRVVFRLCPKCHQRNLIKDGWYHCELCGEELPEEWNFLDAE